MNSPNDNAQKVGVLAVLDAKCACQAISGLRDPMCGDCPAQDAEAAAVNYLRSHGEAIGELIEAAREASATLGHAYHTVQTGELAENAHTDYQRLDAALRQVECL